MKQELIIHPFIPFPNDFNHIFNSIEITQSIFQSNVKNDINLINYNKQINMQPINETIIFDFLNKSLICKNLDFLHIHGCSPQLLTKLLKKFSICSIQTLKIVSTTLTTDSIKILESMKNIQEIILQDFLIDGNHLNLNHIDNITLTMYQYCDNIEEIIKIMNSLTNDETNVEINLGVSLKTIHPQSFTKTKLMELSQILIQHKNHVQTFTIEYNYIGNEILESLIHFVKDNQKLKILDIPTQKCLRDNLLKLFDAIATAKNIEMFLSNQCVYDQVIIDSIWNVLQNNYKIWYFMDDSQFYSSRSIRWNNTIMLHIANKLKDNENKIVLLSKL